MSDLLTFQVCNTCGAFKVGNEFLVSSPGNNKVKWDKDKMFTRICRYAKEKGKDCINSNGVLKPSETIEYAELILDTHGLYSDHTNNEDNDL